jgi:cell division protein FtsQ
VHAGQAWDRLAGNRIALRACICMLLALPLLGGGWLWLRGSSLASVEHVHISGVHGADAIAIRTALDDAATRMSTMDFNASALRSAVSSYAVVGGLHVTTAFPHTVSISVSERLPVAALVSAGQRTAVAADGTVLGPALLSSSLPTVNSSVEPASGARVGEAATLAALTVLGAAPTSLALFITRVYSGGEGLTVAMRNGLLVYFGDATRPHAKWLSLARVLTSPSSAGAQYVDVRLPERPAAGFSSSSASTSTGAQSSGSAPIEIGGADPTAAALAASLERAVGGSSTTSATPASSSESETASSESESAPAESESTSSTATSGVASESEAAPESSTSTGG